MPTRGTVKGLHDNRNANTQNVILSLGQKVFVWNTNFFNVCVVTMFNIYYYHNVILKAHETGSMARREVVSQLSQARTCIRARITYHSISCLATISKQLGAQRI